MPEGTRSGHTRQTKHGPVRVRSTSIQGRRPPQRRRGRGQPRPLLYATYATAGLAAFELIVRGRFISGGLLAVLAVSFGVAHVGWQHHKRRQATKPAKPKKPAARREALEKAREAHQPGPAAIRQPVGTVNGDKPPAEPKRQTRKTERLQREKAAARRAGLEPAVRQEMAAARAAKAEAQR